MINMKDNKENINNINKKHMVSSKKAYLVCKRGIDFLLSGAGLIILSPLLLFLSVAIKIDSKGPVFFRQKRVGLGRKEFTILKFRTMRTDTPKDMPTHLLADPSLYITKLGAWMRKTSIDELPQLINILIGEMSIIGPRPALWNQYDLIEEREKYGANDVLPGLTGWAQVNGRDELEIQVKAKLDGEYVKRLSFAFDLKCFFMTIISVIKHDGVVEGGTGQIHKQDLQQVQQEAIEGEQEELQQVRKKVIIAGANSYVGTSVEKWLMQSEGKYEVSTVDLHSNSLRDSCFDTADTVFYVAGIAHSDIDQSDQQMKQLYYKVNTQLAFDTAKKAKKEGVKQFIFMSSMLVYGDTNHKIITRDTVPNPTNYYGDSKWQAEKLLQTLHDDQFKVVILRPPMIYGKNSKGNYPKLAKMSKRMIIFPKVNNKRSMLYIDNLCQMVKLLIDHEESGVFFPQNDQYVQTTELVRLIAKAVRHKIVIIPGTSWMVTLIMKLPGKIGKLTRKAFGDAVYDMDISVYNKGDYQIYSLAESIMRTEGME